jgi:hypothetical protein
MQRDDSGPKTLACIRDARGPLRRLASFAIACVLITKGVTARCLAKDDPRVFKGAQVSPIVERVYSLGLRFLSANQRDDGTFGDQYGAEAATSALTAMAYLAHGEDPNAGPFAQNIRKHLDYVLAKTGKNGCIGSSMYNHAFSTLALAEAYGIVRDDRLGPALESAVQLILASQAQNPMKAWRYSPTSKDADSTVSGACFVALIAARNSGISVPDSAIKDALAFYGQCQVPSDGTIGYLPKSSPHGPSTTAIGVAAFAYAREKASPIFLRAMTALKDILANSSYSGNHMHYFEYYASQALFQGDFDFWEEWNIKRVDQLLKMQNPDGSFEGNLGPSLSTAFGLLSIALNYRYLPIYER